MHITCRCQIGPKGGGEEGSELIRSRDGDQMTIKMIRGDRTCRVTTYNYGVITCHCEKLVRVVRTRQRDPSHYTPRDQSETPGEILITDSRSVADLLNMTWLYD
jgi:hypothetical protein